MSAKSVLMIGWLLFATLTTTGSYATTYDRIAAVGQSPIPADAAGHREHHVVIDIIRAMDL